MEKILGVISFVGLGVLAAGAVYALDARATSNIRNMESALQSCDPGDLWDGTDIKPTAPPQKVQSWLRSCQSNLSRARGCWDKLGAMDRADPLVKSKQLWERLEKYDAFGQQAANLVQGAATNQ
jgi:hypothetical protein